MVIARTVKEKGILHGEQSRMASQSSHPEELAKALEEITA